MSAISSASASASTSTAMAKTSVTPGQLPLSTGVHDERWHAPQPFALPALKAVGDCALLVEFGKHLTADVGARVLQLDDALTRERIPGVIEAIVAYATLLVIFDPVAIRYEHLRERLSELVSAPGRRHRSTRRFRVPVAYGDAFGLDIEDAAARLGMTQSDLISAHASAEYTIAMFGFLPGFAYLTGLPSHIALPRRATPRARIFSGSIAIGGAQTAIGSIEGPSGWNVIGRTPLRTFDAARFPASFFEPGDEIRFEAIPVDRFDDLAARANAGEVLAERIA